MTTVVIADTSRSLKDSLDKIFAPFSGVREALPDRGGTLYIKHSGIHFTPHTHTDPRALEALLSYLRDHGYRRLAVMESCTGGNFTRLVFKVTGYDRICHRYGARPVYLDEGPTVEVRLEGEEMNILIGGADTLAVDVVGAKVLGYDLREVEHLRLCAEAGLGEGARGTPSASWRCSPTTTAGAGGGR
ncbi:MAG TPA: DUF362 domain-containing protein [Anaerolineales bacterium]|nr:DUF362 domain-containing protein [Anaerolineae bacterium]HIQ00904.1 DUF362 domain-containing protein [Anaerolineales bacterium]